MDARPASVAGSSDDTRLPPGRSGPARSSVLMLAVVTVGFAVNFWAWALLSPLGPLFRTEGTLGTLSESDVALMVAARSSSGRSAGSRSAR
jgi:MFS transporter, NNP family, nitrate/nitrite transporter